MSITITLEQTLALREKGALLVDARSPDEFSEATIPGAVNVPILDNAERTEVGTLYKQVGKRQARQRGVELVAPKIPSMVKQIAALQSGTSQPVVVFCWRGGMRSLALTQFLELAGTPARQLVGGHKAFRRHVLDFFEHGDAFGKIHGLMMISRSVGHVASERRRDCSIFVFRRNSHGTIV